MSTETSEHTPYELANLAEVASPDSPTSPGAEWLLAIASEAGEIIGEDFEPLAELGDVIRERADAIVPVYTYERWQVFVDLAAYSEDVGEYGDVDGGDLTRSVAGVALLIIAERLLHALTHEA